MEEVGETRESLSDSPDREIARSDTGSEEEVAQYEETAEPGLQSSVQLKDKSCADAASMFG